MTATRISRHASALRTTCSGTVRTAIKANVGKYLEGVGTSGNYANANPTLRMPNTLGAFNTQGITRAWTDSNNNFVPDCDLTNSAAQNLTASGGDVCGVMSNVRFGQNVLTNNFDPDLLNGWGVRASDWNVGVTLQQQLFSRASVEVAYSRRSFRGLHGERQRARGVLGLHGIQPDGAARRSRCRTAVATW